MILAQRNKINVRKNLHFKAIEYLLEKDIETRDSLPTVVIIENNLNKTTVTYTLPLTMKYRICQASVFLSIKQK